ncbi:MAG: plastocyanin/azurin family copper-binding protein [Actinomycetota bacterium]|nr:plastocyanin/azurin family copper-binding protein [Actinomycetota bacterium]
MTKILLAATAVAALAIAGCGSSSSTTTSSSTPASTPSTSGAGTVAISAAPSGMLMFNTTSLTAKAGKVTIAFTNNAPVDHNLTIASSSGSVLGATPTFKGGTKMVTLTLKAGTYTFYCSVPGHEMGGMKGKLVVS